MATTQDYNQMAVVAIAERAALNALEALNDELDRYQAQINTDVFTDYGTERDTFVAHAIAEMILRFERDFGHTNLSEMVSSIVSNVHDFQEKQARRHQP